jgi:hypothetical protein
MPITNRGDLFTTDELIRELGMDYDTRTAATILLRFRDGYAKLEEGPDFIRVNKRVILYTRAGVRKMKAAWKEREERRFKKK